MGWTTTTAGEVQPGDRVRVGPDKELLVARVQSPFMGSDQLVCLIEDTADRWLAQPVPAANDVEVLRPD
jgi:hypothetical protein